MNIIKPTRIGDAQLAYSNVPEPDTGDGTEWDAGTEYQVGDLVHVLSVHRRFRAVTASQGVDPTAPVGPDELPSWADMGPTNRWAMFDGALGTRTSKSGDLEVRLLLGDSTTAITLFDLEGRDLRVEMRDGPGGTLIYERDVSLDGTEIHSFYDWFFEPYAQLDEVILSDLPGAFLSAEISVKIEATDTAAVGELVVGRYMEIGCTQYGARAGILDFSRKERDQNFGGMKVVERGYARRANFSVMTEKVDFQRIYRTLAGLRATPCVYIGTELEGFSPLTVFGFYRDFEIAVDYPTMHLLTIEIEGII